MLADAKFSQSRPCFCHLSQLLVFFERKKKKPIGLVGFAGKQTGIAKKLLESPRSCVGSYLDSLSLSEEIASSS